MRLPVALLALAIGTLPSTTRAEGYLSRFGRGLLVRRLLDPDPATRRSAALEIGRRGDREAVPELLARLRTESQLEARRAVITSLGLVADIRAVPLLVEIAVRPGEPARPEAIAALGSIGDARAVAPLATLLSDPRLEESAARALARLGDAALPRLVAMLGDDQAGAGAARALGALGDARAIPGLVAVLSSPLPGHRAAAARALGTLGDSRVRKALAAVSQYDPDPVVRVAATQALVAILPAPEAPPVLGDAVAGQRTLARATTLAASGDDRSQRALESLVRSGQERPETLRALALLAHPRHAMGLHRRSDELRRACAGRPRLEPATCLFVAGAAELDDARAWVLSALGDGDPAIRRAAALALGRLGRGDALRSRYAEERDPTVRAAILWALSEHPELESVPVVLAALRREHDDALLDAIAAAGALADGRLVPPLLDLSSDADRLLRAAAVLALGQSGDPRALAALRARLQSDPDALVRTNAARALGMIDPARSLRALRVAAETDTEPDVRAVAADAREAGLRGRTLPMARGEDVFRARFVDIGGAPAPGLRWVALLPDGRLRAGLSDEAGEVVIFDVPRGTTRLWLQ